MGRGNVTWLCDEDTAAAADDDDDDDDDEEERAVDVLHTTTSPLKKNEIRRLGLQLLKYDLVTGDCARDCDFHG